MFYLGFTKALFSETVYRYRSEGVVLPGENAEIFRNWPDTLVISAENRNERHQKQAEMAQRVAPDTLILSQPRGYLFNEPVAGAEGYSRTYYADGTYTIPRAVNAWLQAIGLFLAVFGVLGLVVQKRIISGIENS